MRYPSLSTTAFLLAVAPLTFAAQNGEQSSPETLELEVRVLLLTSETVPELNCTMSKEEIRELFARVNEVWEQAGIVWQIESIVRTAADEEMQGRFATLVRKSKEVPRNIDRTEMREVVRNIYTSDSKLMTGWNLYVAEDLGRTIGGAYHNESHSVLFAKHGPRGVQTGIVLAHELGHSLGLPHVAKTLKDNLMMTASPLRSPKMSTVLIEQQIAAARRQAARGTPYDVSQRVRALFGQNDANRDGVVTKVEARQVFRNNFALYDANQDERVELIEFQNGFDKTVLLSRPPQSSRSLGLGGYDENSDGKLSGEELGRFWERLALSDANQDGSIDQEEFAEAQTERSQRFKESFRRRFAEADANADGEVTVAESQAGDRPIFPGNAFKRNDQDNNGALDKQELESFLTRARVAPLPPRRTDGGSGRQQKSNPSTADPDFDPKVDRPAFAEGQGPVVLLDEAHFNYHTTEGRYAPFVKLIRRDGYVVRANSEEFSRKVLDDAQVLVIANALAEQNQGNWRIPTPSAFTRQEIDSVVKWVSDGGSLLLIADHMPFAGAARDLGSAFDAKFLNGFALRKDQERTLRFDRERRQLHDHAVTRGRDEGEKVDWVSTFAGSAFQIGGQLQPILEFGPDVESIQPEVAWQFSADTPRENVDGWCQAAVGKYGKGRVAVFGEAAMFTAQRSVADGRRVGMNAPEAAQNGQLVLNTLHWLTGLLAN